MMYLHARHSPEAPRYQLRDLDVDKIIPHCLWANDETGEYCVYVTDGGRFVLTRDEYGQAVEVEERVKKGRIRLEKLTKMDEERDNGNKDHIRWHAHEGN